MAVALLPMALLSVTWHARATLEKSAAGIRDWTYINRLQQLPQHGNL